MMRLLGAGLVAAAGIWLGMALSGRLARRAASLERVVYALRHLRSRIVHLAMPLPEALAQSGALFARAGQQMGTLGMEAAFAQALAEEALTREDLRCLTSYAQMMASMRREDCAHVCDGAVDAMQLRLEEAKQTAQKNGRLYRSLGACVGLAIAILMI